MPDEDLLDRGYALWLEVNARRRTVFQDAKTDQLVALRKLEAELSELQKEAGKQGSGSGVILDTKAPPGSTREVRGLTTTGLEARAELRMTQLPTAICHLLNRTEHPLITITVGNGDRAKARRVRIISYIDGYSAHTVDTVEIEVGKEATVHHLPTLFPDRLRTVTELTAATVHVQIEDLDGRMELHRTETVHLLARTAAPLEVLDPVRREWKDLTRYLGAFVTPNAPEVLRFLRTVADRHPDRTLANYSYSTEDLELQVKAVYDALQTEGLVYISSLSSFGPDDGMNIQRVRLPRESLADREANCIDGTVLVASLLEAMSISAALVILPGHALVGWETRPGGDEWRFLETTMLGSAATFEQARTAAEDTVGAAKALLAERVDERQFLLLPLRELRGRDRITPME